MTSSISTETLLTRRQARAVERRTGVRPQALPASGPTASALIEALPAAGSAFAAPAPEAHHRPARRQTSPSRRQLLLAIAASAGVVTATGIATMLGTGGQLAQVGAASLLNGTQDLPGGGAARSTAVASSDWALPAPSTAGGPAVPAPEVVQDRLAAAAGSGEALTQAGSATSSPQSSTSAAVSTSGSSTSGTIQGASTSSSSQTSAPVSRAQYAHPYPTGRMNEGYGTRGGAHNGIDMAGGGCGADLIAVAAGTVTFAGYSGGYGNHVEVRLEDGTTTVSYSHLQDGGIAVSVGQQLQAGDYIGEVGTTGNSTGCHLHFEVKLNGSFTDPVPWLSERGISVS